MPPIKYQSVISKAWRITNLFITGVLLVTAGGCTLPFGQGNNANGPVFVEKAQVIVTVDSHRPLDEGAQIEFVIADEVTGLPYHQERYPLSLMQDGSYGTVYEAPVSTVITYFFQKVSADGSIAHEVQASNEPVWCRRYLVSEPGLLRETVAGWEDDAPRNKEFAEISGVILSDELGDPLKDILVSAGGAHALTDAEGAFTIYPVIPGTHTISAISMTGTYLPAQNSVVTSGGKVTWAELMMTPSIWREVTFRVKVPEDTIEGAPVRLAGNLAQLGNTFYDLGGGISTDAGKMPMFTAGEDGWYSLKYLLPAGVDIRYKYTMGDGFWNAEHGVEQSFITHQLILPYEGGAAEIEDVVFSWRSSNTQTIWFRADLPENTPPDETIGIQFSIADWLPALPMLRVSENSWAFPLISPHNFSGEIPYRFCRETPCTGVGQAGIESLATSRQIPTNFTETHLTTEPVAGWTFLSGEEGPSLKTESPSPAGMENGYAISPISPHSSPIPENASHVILSPAWAPLEVGSPRSLAPSLEHTIRWDQLTGMVRAAHDQGKTVSLYPQVVFAHGAAEWWLSQPTETEVFWLDFLNDYRDFAFQFAEQGLFAGVDGLVLGGEWLEPALPIGDNFSVYSQPGNIERIWERTLEMTREIFPGEIGFVLTLAMAEEPPGFLANADAIYLQWDLPVEENLSLDEMVTQLGDALDEIAQPLTKVMEKPLVILLAVPSLKGYHQACIPSPNDEGECVDTSNLKLGPALENPAAADLEMQAKYYYAFLSAVSEREWISGVISQGYYPELALHDTSASIHGKPAEEIFDRWLAKGAGN